MNKFAFCVLAMTALLATPAIAACPPPTPGDTAAEIKANADRLVCLQTVLAGRTELRRMQMELEALNERLRQIEVQNRFTTLPQPPVIVAPPLFP